MLKTDKSQTRRALSKNNGGGVEWLECPNCGATLTHPHFASPKKEKWEMKKVIKRKFRKGGYFKAEKIGPGLTAFEMEGKGFYETFVKNKKPWS